MSIKPAEAQAELKALKNFKPPASKITWDLTRPLRRYFSPKFYGLENVDPDFPALYVTNHTIFGFFDGPMLGAKLHKEKGIFMRGLVDNMHFEIPFWKDYFQRVGGAVRGTRDNCALLMEQRDHILVFPGGSREVFKKKGEKYTLTWKQRVGFVKMAVMYGYPIIPVAGVGGDDVYNIVYDSNDIMNSFVGKILKQTGIADKFFKGGEMIPPIAKGIGLGGLFPRPERFYYGIGEPISTKEYAGKADDTEALLELRGKVEDAMNEQFKMLFKIREDEKQARAKKPKGLFSRR